MQNFVGVKGGRLASAMWKECEDRIVKRNEGYTREHRHEAEVVMLGLSPAVLHQQIVNMSHLSGIQAASTV